MHTETTQASLLSRVRDPADHEAWRRFHEKYLELIRRYCLRRGLSAADAEDVHQMVMMRLVRSLPGFAYDPARGRFRDYLYRTVRSAISDHVSRPNHAAAPVDPGGLPEATGSDPADNLWEQEWTDHHFRLALANVRVDFEARSVEMFERIMAGDPIEAVAAAFGTTTQAVHKVKQRIRDRMKELIDAQIRDEERL